MNRLHVLQIGVFSNSTSEDGLGLSLGTKTRCDAAVECVLSWLSWNSDTSYPSVIIYLPSGSGGRWRGETTFAVAMEEYIKGRLKEESSKCIFVVNRNSEKVWSTLHEVGWILEKIEDRSKLRLSASIALDPVRLVTNPVHAKRVRFILRHFHPKVEVGTFLFSTEAPPPFLHEVCAYIKLGFEFVGLGSLIEPLRRKYYNG